MVLFSVPFTVVASFLVAAVNAQDIPCRPDKPVTFYRIFSEYGRMGPYTGANNHLYTTSIKEVDAAFPRYIREPDCCKVYTISTMPPPPPVGGGFQEPDPYDLHPLYRLFSPRPVEDHWFTTSKLEYDRAVAAGDVGDGIIAWIRGAAGCGTLPLYRMVMDNGSFLGRDHLLTVSNSERDGLIAGGVWKDEGIIGYVWPA